MKKIPNYKRIPINVEPLIDAINEKRYSLTRLAKKAGMSESVLSDSIHDKKMNPAVLQALEKYIDFDINEVCPNIRYERVYNGRGTRSGRMRVDWDYLKRVADAEGYSFYELSRLLGHNNSYLYTAKAVGGLSADVIVKLAEILGVEPETIADYIEPGAANIVKLINDQKY